MHDETYSVLQCTPGLLPPVLTNVATHTQHTHNTHTHTHTQTRNYTICTKWQLLPPPLLRLPPLRPPPLQLLPLLPRLQVSEYVHTSVLESFHPVCSGVLFVVSTHQWLTAVMSYARVCLVCAVSVCLCLISRA